MSIGNALILGWSRAVRGREQEALELFAIANNYYEARKKAGEITSYEHVFMRPHGGDLNGFTIVKGDPAKLDALLRSEEWLALETKAMFLLEGQGVIRATTGPEGTAELVRLYAGSIPKK